MNEYYKKRPERQKKKKKKKKIKKKKSEITLHYMYIDTRYFLFITMLHPRDLHYFDTLHHDI